MTAETSDWWCEKYPDCECFAGCQEKALENRHRTSKTLVERLWDYVQFKDGPPEGHYLIMEAIQEIERLTGTPDDVKACQHQWEPVDNYDDKPTGFDVCSKCGEDRESPENERPADVPDVLPKSWWIERLKQQEVLTDFWKAEHDKHCGLQCCSSLEHLAAIPVTPQQYQASGYYHCTQCGASWNVEEGERRLPHQCTASPRNDEL